MMFIRTMLIGAALLAMTLPAEANGAKRTVVVREAPTETVYVYERRPAPLVSVGVLGGGIALYDEPIGIDVDLDLFDHDVFLGTPFFSGRRYHRHHLHGPRHRGGVIRTRGHRDRR